MAAQSNVEILKNMFAELANGNTEAFLSVLDDDIEWTLIGTTSISNTYRGKQSVIEDFLGPVMDKIDGHIHITPENFIADGDFVALQGHGKAATKAGGRYDNTYCWVYRFNDGKIASVTEYLDTELVRQVFG